MDRLTYFCEHCNNYYAAIDNNTNKTIKIKKGQVYFFNNEIVEKLATFENLMDAYNIDTFADLSQILSLHIVEKNDN